jgi:hypothetical protein
MTRTLLALLCITWLGCAPAKDKGPLVLPSGTKIGIVNLMSDKPTHS